MDLLNIMRSDLRVGETMAAAAASTIANNRGVATIPAIVRPDLVATAGGHPRRPTRATTRPRRDEDAADAREEAAEPATAPNLYTAMRRCNPPIRRPGAASTCSPRTGHDLIASDRSIKLLFFT